MSLNESPGSTPGSQYWLRRSVAIAGFALVAAAVPVAVLAPQSGSPTNLADCAIGWVWDPGILNCVPYVDPVLGPVLGPVGPVGVGGVIGPVGIDPILGPVGPIGVGRR